MTHVLHAKKTETFEFFHANYSERVRVFPKKIQCF